MGNNFLEPFTIFRNPHINIHNFDNLFRNLSKCYYSERGIENTQFSYRLPKPNIPRNPQEMLNLFPECIMQGYIVVWFFFLVY